MSKIEVNAIEPQCGTTLTVGAAGTTVTVPSNVVKSNALQASDAGNIISQSGTTITLGATGDSINLASGATQSGFGRTGTVDWDTTPKTATFTAVNGTGYFCNTTAGAFNITLPISPTAGDIVALKDYNGTFATYNLTIDRNGSNLNGASSNFAISTANTSMTLVYVDSTEGWIPVEEGTGYLVENFISATGGTITECGDCKIHTFTGPGTFTVCGVADCSANNQVSYITVAGGGGGGYYYGGAGGAGGFREDKSPITPYTASPLDGAGPITVSATGYTIAVGGGGASANYPTTTGTNGSPSTFSSITSTGGGAGSGSPSGGSTGQNGGSGGGGGGISGSTRNGGSGNTPPVSPPQGNNGGSVPSPEANLGAGGGGAGGAAASSGPTISIRTGGVGAGTAINPAAGTPGPSGSLKYFAGGGAGGPGTPCAPGGYGGGGDYCGSGTVNTGGGGGADGGAAGSGGSGIVIIRYKFQ